MSSSQAHGGEGIPRSFPEVPPSGDLAGYKGTIAFGLGELSSRVTHLSDAIKEQSLRNEKFQEGVISDLKDQKKQLEEISGKVSTAEGK